MKTHLSEKVKKAMICKTRQCWEQGIATQALLEMGEFDTLKLMIYDTVLRQSEDGRLCNIESTPATIDSSFNIFATYETGKHFNEARYINAALKNVAYLLNSAPKREDGLLYHMYGTKEVWADSAAFAPAVLAFFGYPDKAAALMKSVLACLYDESTGLYYHIWDDEKKAYTRKVLWGVGNGWILTGLYRLYSALPADSPHRHYAKSEFIRLLNCLLSFESSDHRFHDEINHPASFKETEVAEMIAYSIYKAVSCGMIDKSYLERADAIRAVIQALVSKDGLVLECSSSPHFLESGTSVEGQAHFLLMEAAADTCAR